MKIKLFLLGVLISISNSDLASDDDFDFGVKVTDVSIPSTR